MQSIVNRQLGGVSPQKVRVQNSINKSIIVQKYQKIQQISHISRRQQNGQKLREQLVTKAEAEVIKTESLDPVEKVVSVVTGPKLAPQVVTLGFIALWYAMNIGFNLTNKTIFNYFPYPWTVSTVHVIVGTIYCGLTYIVGLKDASFRRPITGTEFKSILGPASMHAIGHIAANLSFAAVAISLTHTVKTLEPVFNVIMSYLCLGETTSAAIMVTLVPIMAGVSLASASELTFNWLGFSSAMVSNLTFSLRAVWGKVAMGAAKDLGGTAVYAYTTLISVFICLPFALLVEGKSLMAGVNKAIELKGAQIFYGQLLAVGILYHLYNQFAFNTLERVDPVSHGVCNVVKRVAIIGSSVLFFGNKLTPKTQIGTAVAILGTYLYTRAKSAGNKQKALEKAKEVSKSTQ